MDVTCPYVHVYPKFVGLAASETSRLRLLLPADPLALFLCAVDIGSPYELDIETGGFESRELWGVGIPELPFS